MPIGDPLPHCQDTGCVYLDYNGTTPIFPEVVEAMQPFLEQFGNPSSSHVYGRMCKAAVDKARCHVAQLIHCDPDEIVFTSCGTESDNCEIFVTGSIHAPCLEDRLILLGSAQIP